MKKPATLHRSSTPTPRATQSIETEPIGEGAEEGSFRSFLRCHDRSGGARLDSHSDRGGAVGEGEEAAQG